MINDIVIRVCNIRHMDDDKSVAIDRERRSYQLIREYR